MYIKLVRKVFIVLISFTIVLIYVFVNFFQREQITIIPNELTGSFDHQNVQGIFKNNKIVSTEVAYKPIQIDKVLGISDNKRIEVDLSNQKLYAYEGDNLIYTFLISSGKWGRTPTGTFQI